MAAQIGYEILVKIIWKLVGNYEKLLKNHEPVVLNRTRYTSAEILLAHEKELEITRKLRRNGNIIL